MEILCDCSYISPEILRAAKILHQMEVAHASERGAVGLDGEMIDAPMLKQVRTAVHPTCVWYIMTHALEGKEHNLPGEDSRVRYPSYWLIFSPGQVFLSHVYASTMLPWLHVLYRLSITVKLRR